MVKQIDDSLLWASDIKEAYENTARYLQLVGENGIILNKKKFVFAEEEVDFAGFHLTTDGVKPLSKHLDAIRNFPPPEEHQRHAQLLCNGQPSIILCADPEHPGNIPRAPET